MDTLIPTYHLNFKFLLFLFVNFLCGRSIDLLIDVNNDCSIRVSCLCALLRAGYVTHIFSTMELKIK